jgi:putative phosphoribosyl transferase
MIFENRAHAAKELAKKLKQYTSLQDAIVLGLPRGGVVTGYEIAKELHLPLDIISLRKIGAPFNKELAIGAISEKGIGFFNHPLIAKLNVSKEYIIHEVEKEKKTAKDRLILYRKNRPPLDIKGKTVFLVDDGLATGATMKAAIQSVKAEEPHAIIVAIPVAPPDTLEEIQELAGKVICLYAPTYFSAVGQFYEEFKPTSDEEVIHLLEMNRQELQGWIDE